MQKTKLTKCLLLTLCILLIAATALCMNGCKQNAPSGETFQTESTVVGEGKTVFPFSVIDASGKEKVFEIHTDKTTVGEALLEHNLIKGEQSEYGLFVKTVDGITADYDKDGAYWAFYVDGAYATAGVDATEIKEGATYAFKIEKA